MANKGWSKRFDEPIVLDDGTTADDAAAGRRVFLAKTWRSAKAERDHEKVLIAARPSLPTRHAPFLFDREPRWRKYCHRRFVFN